MAVMTAMASKSILMTPLSRENAMMPMSTMLTIMAMDGTESSDGMLSIRVVVMDWN